MPRRTALTHLAPLLLVPVAVTILLLALIGAQASAPPRSCATSPGAGPPTPADTHLDAGQRSVAAQIVAAVRAFGPTSNTPRAAVVALATARQESGIRNLDYGDRDSLGVFQQRPSQGWGTPGQVMDVAHATTSFLRHLVQVPGWQTMRVTDAAATVQRPAEEYRGLYERWVPLATSLTERLWPAASGAIGITTSGQTCGPVVPTSRGSAGYPIPAALIDANRDNWGASGGSWSSWHTGTDFSVPCGTPVLAATGGTISIDTTQAWAGRWLVKVETGPKALTTWYGHMRSVSVPSGRPVSAGQPIGEVGDLGNATGCHLHFEVHLHNGSIYAPDNTDPTRWLAAHAARSPVRPGL